MRAKLPRLITIDPTSPQDDDVFFSILSHFQYVNEYDLLTYNDPSQKDIQFTLSHPVFKFEKPDRESTKTGKKKAAQAYYGVMDPEPIGSGAYGSVFRVLGTWHHTPDGWVYKTKTNSYTRLVKTNLEKTSAYPVNTPSNYIKEQLIGKYVPHMSYKYPPTTHNNISFLLMREQKGINLQEIINLSEQYSDYLTVTQRLKITVNLLVALKTQVNGIRFNQSGKPFYLVHRDIKPENILVTKDCEVTIIDYGLAIPNNTAISRAGTAFFMDAKLYAGQKTKENRVSDLASVGRVIAALWGDQSHKNLVYHNELLRRNRFNILTGLLDNIILTADEQAILRNAISAMTSYEENDRLTRRKALKIFKRLLDARLQEEERTFSEIASTGNIKGLTSRKLLQLLKSPHSATLIANLKKEPTHLKHIFRKINSRIVELSDQTLTALHEAGLDFSKPRLIHGVLKHAHFSGDQLRLLIKLGAAADEQLFTDWLANEDARNNPLKWVTACRVLFEALPNAKDIIAKKEPNDPFKTLFCKHFLTKQSTEKADKSNVRLILQHLQVMENQEQMITTIIETLKTIFPETSNVFALVRKEAQVESTSGLVLVDSLNLDSLANKINELIELQNVIDAIDVFPDMPERDRVIVAILDLLDDAQTLFETDLDSAFAKIDEIKELLPHLQDLDYVYFLWQDFRLSISMKDVNAMLQPYYAATIDYENELTNDTPPVVKSGHFKDCKSVFYTSTTHAASAMETNGPNCTQESQHPSRVASLLPQATPNSDVG